MLETQRISPISNNMAMTRRKYADVIKLESPRYNIVDLAVYVRACIYVRAWTYHRKARLQQ